MKIETKPLPDPRIAREDEGPWHGAINRFQEDARGRGEKWRRWMYDGKTLALEVPRLILLFAMEREGKLPKIHRQCSMSETQPVEDNHLTCCLGIECRACPELIAIGGAELSPEATDRAKAWTCAAHILSNGGDRSGEGYIVTTDDIMYWRAVHESLAQPDEPADETVA